MRAVSSPIQPSSDWRRWRRSSTLYCWLSDTCSSERSGLRRPTSCERGREEAWTRASAIRCRHRQGGGWPLSTPTCTGTCIWTCGVTTWCRWEDTRQAVTSRASAAGQSCTFKSGQDDESPINSMQKDSSFQSHGTRRLHMHRLVYVHIERFWEAREVVARLWKSHLRCSDSTSLVSYD